jgi:GNAT superfamily N-acetyltransferase
MRRTVPVDETPTRSSAWTVRVAETTDAEAVAGAVRELLLELGATPPPDPAMAQAARELLADPELGTVLVAEVDGALMGVLSASWQTAIHVPGRYGSIQDLWVHPEWRGQAVGAGLLTGLLDHAGESGVTQLEVGLPKESFPGLAGTRAFYEANGFETLGTRMRRPTT